MEEFVHIEDWEERIVVVPAGGVNTFTLTCTHERVINVFQQTSGVATVTVRFINPPNGRFGIFRTDVMAAGAPIAYQIEFPPRSLQFHCTAAAAQTLVFWICRVKTGCKKER